MNSTRDNTAAGVQRQQTMMGGLLDQLDRHNDRLFSAIARLELCIERIVGPEPQPGTDGRKEAEAISLAQQLAARLDASERAAARLLTVAEKFEQLA